MKATILLLLLSLTAPLAHGRVGNDQGNGGDLYSTEFVRQADRLATYLEYTEAKDVDFRALRAAIARTKVESTDEPLLLNGLPKDAINYPSEPRIVFNRQRWQALDSGEKPVLVLHEYLGIMGVNDASYVLSKRWLGAFRFDVSYDLNCTIDGHTGYVTVGIDESAGMDTVLLGAKLEEKDEDFVTSMAMRPVGEFSRMIRDGNFSMAFGADEESKNDDYLLSLHADGPDFRMSGHFAGFGKILPVHCQVKQIDMSVFEDKGDVQ